MTGLVLSLFPGIGLLDRAFEEEGFTVVRGPDVLWGGDVRRFCPPSGVFDGVIGGPPCQAHSVMRSIQPRAGEEHGDLIPEFCRVVGEAAPGWFVMENVPGAPSPVVAGYAVSQLELDNRWLGEVQRRRRRFSFGTPQGVSLVRFLEVAPLEHISVAPTVLAGHGASRAQRLARGGREVSLEEMCEWQGLPPDFLRESPFSKQGQRKVIGNGVPLPMGRAVARAVKRAVADQTNECRAS
jgi:DNA (cytosine-5)-methyltransferase 1